MSSSGGGAAACSSYAGSGCAAASFCSYLACWRRATRPLTAVAVPAITAVRATPLTRPGPLRIMLIALRSCLVGGRPVLGLLHDLAWDPVVVEELAAAVPDGF